MGKRVVKISAVCLLCVIGLMVLVVGGYVLYIIAQYSRHSDNLPLTVHGQQSASLNVGEEYSILTYNIGFGAYDSSYSFFMDYGEMLDGTKVSGKYGKGVSKQNVQANTNGSIDIVKNANADIVLLQEVDESATRSYNINQLQAVKEIEGYSSVYAENFHSAYLFYPFSDPHGKVNSGIVTLSRFALADSVRRSFPVTNNFFAKFFDLDRCFTLHRLQVGNNKTLTLINLHMSAYDEGGLIRTKQVEMLNQVIAEEIEAGNYVIAGGDFNHDIANTVGKFETQQKQPDWVFVLTNSDLTSGVEFVADSTAPSCRSADIPYQEGVNYTVSIDGFIVSSNISTRIETISNGFAYSDHHAVLMHFTLE